ncbi:hypothetical protein ADU37_CDS15250 [Thermococcus sp. 2319x1]|nr:hypothetical protein ADU37_CDS15250 [Thermococcus sp. 2319x1]
MNPRGLIVEEIELMELGSTRNEEVRKFWKNRIEFGAVAGI